ncbi:MAG: hypothetical protein KIT89_09960 [Microcella sp.]|uniref:hypothetical protein n=1 Tax=Microcella sp. TaxID=1913979 RepID=UPI0024C8166F|nr:hypothetical protein [Microcella sp.]UYN83024.1 MAG: hypothetical protein KIT89_09960 [Microcella sp.]
MNESGGGCSTGGPASHRVAELRRQARVAEELGARLDAMARGLPGAGDVEGWRGIASDLFSSGLHELQAEVIREAERLHSVSMQFEGAAAVLERESALLAAP